jgi:TDG/mug DNA glycosylase family protein
MRCDTVDSEPLMTEPVVPNEIAKALGITGLRLRSWLRAEKHAGHPLLADHQHRRRWQFTPAEAEQLIVEFRSASTTAGSSAIAPPSEQRLTGRTNAAHLAIGDRASVTSRNAGATANTVQAQQAPGCSFEGHRLSLDPGHRVTDIWMGETVFTLADLVRPGLRGVVVGINPSPVSVAEGHYYRGTLGRRFWTSLRDADVVPIGAGFDDDRAFVAGLGFTDVVKRATARETGLRPGELQHGRALLETRLADVGVSRILFTFKKAATALLGPFDGFGLLPGRPIADAEVFVMSGPMAKTAVRVHAITQLREWWKD